MNKIPCVNDDKNLNLLSGKYEINDFEYLSLLKCEKAMLQQSLKALLAKLTI